ncbi:MAG: hypothetical protein OXP71_16370 [Candidatus Poribacteria bacterium]|nr:hypothetical protein [Candidatus Poribacteria bacterium]
MSEKLESINRAIYPTEDEFVQALRNLIVEIVQDTLGKTASKKEHEPRKKKRDGTRLKVVMPDGETIEHLDATHTMELVVAKLGAILGFERLANKCPNLLSRDPDSVAVSSVPHGEYYIFNGGSTHARLRKLRNAAKAFEEISELKVEQLAKHGRGKL